MKRLPFWQRPFFAKKILEVGGGHDPYAGVTHAVDKFPGDNAQRGGDYVLPSGARFFEGDLEALPFAEGETFDFLYASHVFEHLRDPARAVSEINKFCRKGYIETPSPLREQLACPVPFQPDDFHTLFVWSRGGELHYVRKRAEVIGQFPPTRAGEVMRLLYRMRREEGIDLEPYLSRAAKTTKHFFTRPLVAREHRDFLAASEAGCCAFEESVRTVLMDIRFPFTLRARRFQRLQSLLAPRLAT